MALIDKETGTIAYYNQNAEQFKSFRGAEISHYWQHELGYFHKLLPTGRVLEVGCGTGNEALLLHQLGYEYFGIDPSLSVIKLAQQLNPSLHFQLATLPQLDFPGRSFDGFLAFASLLHVPKESIHDHLRVLDHLIRPGGVGLITIKQGIGEEIRSDGRYFAYYNQDEFTQALMAAGHFVLDVTSRPDTNYDWLVFFVQT